MSKKEVALGPKLNYGFSVGKGEDKGKTIDILRKIRLDTFVWIKSL